VIFFYKVLFNIAGSYHGHFASQFLSCLREWLVTLSWSGNWDQAIKCEPFPVFWITHLYELPPLLQNFHAKLEVIGSMFRRGTRVSFLMLFPPMSQLCSFVK